MQPRARLRALGMGLATVTGIARRGWFVPCRYASSFARAGTYPELEELFAAAKPRFAEVLDAIDSLDAALADIGRGNPPQPRWNQGWFPRLDAAAAYAMMRKRRPSLVVEVGAGHSTRFLARAVADGGLDTRIVTIDPEPRADIAALEVEHLSAAVHEAGFAPFEALQSGDILFVDSSHILMPGSDVDLLLNRIWPILPAGVLVHFHDILLPDGYPESWTWRGYNEQLGVAALLFAAAATVLFSSRYVVTRMPEAVERSAASGLPLMADAIETSLWVEKADTGRGGFVR